VATSVRLGAKEVAELRAGRVPESLLDKIERAEMLRAGATKGLGAQRAVELFAEVLGSRLVRPPSGAGQSWGAMAARLKTLGLTETDCRTIARVAAAGWRPGPIRAESLVRQADVLLAGAQQQIPGVGSRVLEYGWQGAAPVEDE
jgi:hypothetical protein